MKSSRFALILCLFYSFTQAATFTGSDYTLAMRTAVKFFGAQRCGNTHNWMLYDNPNTTKLCHTKDACNGHDMTGGWHDCGDHIKVATTMGYAAVCLLSAYDLWPAAFEDDHDTAYGSKDKIPDVLNEVKVATDYFMKSLFSDGTFVYYVANGDFDHQRWVTSSFQSTLSVELGGDPRPSTASNSQGGAQVANYASALALMAMHYPDTTYAKKCRDEAVRLYTWAKAHPSNINIPSFYSSPNSEISDEFALAGILMYRLTGDASYKSDAVAALNGKWESNSPLAWDTEADIAYYYLVDTDSTITNGQKDVTIASFLSKNVKQAISNANSYGIPWNWFKSNWGTNKLAAGTAFSAALYAKLIQDGKLIPGKDAPTLDAAVNFNKKVIDYMLGNNEFNHPFIHGFKGDMNFKVHHRNAMGRNDNPPTDEKNRATFLFASGALIGGPKAAGSFSNIIEGGDAYMETESGCDYNGPFVAALANVVARTDPKVSTGYSGKVRLKSLPMVRFNSVYFNLPSAGEIFSCNGRKAGASDVLKNPGLFLIKDPQIGTGKAILLNK